MNLKYLLILKTAHAYVSGHGFLFIMAWVMMRDHI